jgi:hypothetical protein
MNKFCYIHGKNFRLFLYDFDVILTDNRYGIHPVK